MGGACSSHGRGEKRIKNLVAKPERKRPLGRSRSRWGDNVSCTGHGPVTGSCEHSNEHSVYIRGGEFPDYLNDS
jgi:hypothetical protein